jgi:ABC-2 type transport system ATP-binding protein
MVIAFAVVATVARRRRATPTGSFAARPGEGPGTWASPGARTRSTIRSETPPSASHSPGSDLARPAARTRLADLAALSIQSLSKQYGSTQALAQVDLEVAEGELCGLLGPNGAGKSTLAKITCGLVKPTAGSVQVFGAQPGSSAANGSIGYLAELFRFPEWLTADEVLVLHQRLSGSDGGEEERRRLLTEVGLGDEAGRRVATMSKGMQQRLGLAQALVGSPRLLLLDEPSSALDPAGRRAVRGLLAGMRERGIAVLLSSHLLSEVELICDRVAILFRGQMVAEGAPAELTGATGVEVETDDGVRSFPDIDRDGIPALVRRLVSEGVQVFGVRQASSTLEDFYIETVAEESAE